MSLAALLHVQQQAPFDEQPALVLCHLVPHANDLARVMLPEHLDFALRVTERLCERARSHDVHAAIDVVEHRCIALERAGLVDLFNFEAGCFVFHNFP